MSDELRLTLGDPCEALMCPNDATMTVVDDQSKPWRVCEDHAQYYRATSSLRCPRCARYYRPRVRDEVVCSCGERARAVASAIDVAHDVRRVLGQLPLFD